MQNPGRVKAWNSLAAYLCAKALGEEARDKICKFSGAAEQQYKQKSSQRCRICGALSPEQRRERATGKHGQAHLCSAEERDVCSSTCRNSCVQSRSSASRAQPTSQKYWFLYKKSCSISGIEMTAYALTVSMNALTCGVSAMHPSSEAVCLLADFGTGITSRNTAAAIIFCSCHDSSAVRSDLEQQLLPQCQTWTSAAPNFLPPLPLITLPVYQGFSGCSGKRELWSIMNVFSDSRSGAVTRQVARVTQAHIPPVAAGAHMTLSTLKIFLPSKHGYKLLARVCYALLHGAGNTAVTSNTSRRIQVYIYS